MSHIQVFLARILFNKSQQLGLSFTLALTLTLGWVVIVQAGSPGDLDPSFSSDGKVITSLGISSGGNSIAVQPDGKIVVAGSTGGWEDNRDFAIVRYNNDGSLDSSFDTDGKVTTDFGRQEGVSDMVIQADGKIIAVGSTSLIDSNPDFAIARYNSDGSLDSSFGVEGKVETNFVDSPFGDSLDYASSVAIQTDGKIVVAGTTEITWNSLLQNFAIARYNPDGSLDTSFGTGGKVTINFSYTFNSLEDYARDVVIQPDGKIVVVGYSSDRNVYHDFSIVRLNPSGSLDTSFDVDGKVTTDFGTYEEGVALALQDDGKIVVAGGTGFDSAKIVLARYHTNGSLDTSFGVDGKVLTNLTEEDRTYDMVMQTDGKIIVVGKAIYTDDFIVVRFQNNGTFDASFGNSGGVTTNFFTRPSGATSRDLAQAVALQPDGKIVVAGYSNSGGEDNFAVARYLNLNTPELSLAKTLEPENGLILPGDPITYTILVSNSGSVDAEGVVITDTLPTYLNGVNLNQVVNISAGESITLTLNATLAHNAPSGKVITNTAFFSHTYSKGQDSVGFVVKAPYLMINKTVQAVNNPVQPGDPLTYTIVVANHGAGKATGVIISDTLPTHIFGNDIYQLVDLSPGEMLTFTLKATLTNNVSLGQVITNTAFFSHSSGGGQATASIVTGKPQLVITKTVHLGENPIQPGDHLTYTIIVANHGTGNAKGVKIEDELPVYLEGPNLNQMLNIAAGKKVTFTLDAKIADKTPSGVVITNTASFSHTSGYGQDSTAITVMDKEPDNVKKIYIPIILRN